MKTFSLNALSEMFEIDRGVSVRASRDLEPDAEVTKGRPTFKVATFAAALEIHRAKNASNNFDGKGNGSGSGSGGSTESDTANLTQARIRIALANAEAKERKNKIESGEFLPALKILEGLTPTFVTMREIALSLPGKIADTLANYCVETISRALTAGRVIPESVESCRNIAFEIVRREVHENLENLSSPESYIEAYKKMFEGMRARGDGEVAIANDADAATTTKDDDDA